MRAIFHNATGDEEDVKVLDIFVDEEGTAKVLFMSASDGIATAPINRFTDYEGGAEENDNLDKGRGMDN